MALRVASADLSDDEFLSAFESGTLDPSRFRHGDHLRFAWLALQRMGTADAERFVASAIRRFANRHGAAHLYHETMTLGWVRLIATHHESSFDEFLTANECRLNAQLLHRFWSVELLESDLAKREWVAPDKQALPR
jgi:CDP-diacylglycerol--glycerol-3-phosphate 3-phosphatidyltransferase